MTPARVNAVAPGMMNSNYFKYSKMTEAEIRGLERRMATANPMNRICTIE